MQFLELTTEAEVKELIEWHNVNSKYIVLDTETTGLDPFTDKLTAIILLGRTADSSYSFAPEWVKALQGLRIPVVAHNFRFDFNMLFRSGVDLRTAGLAADTMLLDHLLDENQIHALDNIVQRRYGDDYKAVFWGKYKNFSDAPKSEQLEYACKDVIYTNRLYKDLLAELGDEGIPESLIQHTHKLALALYDTELNGLKVDVDYIAALGVELKPKIDAFQISMRRSVEGYCQAVEMDLYAKELNKRSTPKGKAGVERPQFNFDSAGQLCTLLYDKLRLPPQFNKARNRSVDDDALERNATLHPVIPMIQEYRGYQKTYTAFIEGTLERMRDGRIYPRFNVNGTVTGRISSSDPNMQQLPAKGEWAKVRGIYIPDTGNRLITCDYGMLEVVIAAHFSQDPNLLKIIYEGASKHDITAQALGISRNLAKTLNFAMQYQCSPRKVRQIVGCSERESEHIWNKYWETYAGEKRIVDECKQKVDRGEAIVNPFGRRRRFPARFDSQWRREAAYRQAYSSLIQGTGADCTHWAFYSVGERLNKKSIGVGLFEVHDEIVIESAINSCAEAADMLKSTMLEAGKVANLTVPLTVDCSEPLVRWEK